MISTEKIIIHLNKLLRNLLFHIIFWYCSFILFFFLTGEKSFIQFHFNFFKLENIYYCASVWAISTAFVFTVLDVFFAIKLASFLPAFIMVIFKSFTYCLSIFIIIIILTQPLKDIILITNINQLFTKIPVLNIHFSRFLVFFYFSCFLNNFYKGMVRKMGRRNFYSWIFGLLNKPREEERIFMFMDMKSSTTIAEKLQHKKFSRLVKDVFSDMSVVDNYDGEIYQYLGDGAIVSWKVKKGLKRNNVLNAFFAFVKAINKRSKYYQRRYGLVPKIKAGIHIGKVIVMQVGQIKKDISYNGDTVNTAARIESMCNELRQNLLISSDLYEIIQDKKEFNFKNIGEINLKGKKKAIEIYQVKAKIKRK